MSGENSLKYLEKNEEKLPVANCLRNRLIVPEQNLRD